MGLVDLEERGVGKGKGEPVEISADVLLKFRKFSEHGTCILRIGENLPFSTRNYDYTSYHVIGDENSFSIYAKYYV